MTSCPNHTFFADLLTYFCCKKSLVRAGSHAQVDIKLQICRHKSLSGEVTHLLT